jgi:hypothetical protein
VREMIYGDLACQTADATRCDCCKRPVERVRSSMWHGEHRICLECFGQWYDPDNGSFDNTNPVELGNYVRSKHGLPPLEPQP